MSQISEAELPVPSTVSNWLSHASEGHDKSHGPIEAGPATDVATRAADRPTMSIILATLNEAPNITVILSELEKEMAIPYEVVIVDDGSVDGTQAILRSWSARHANVRPILNPRSQTLLRAHFQAVSHANGEYVIVMDSDLQHPVSAVGTIARELHSGFDVVVGSRYAEGGSTGEREAVRGAISRAAEMLARLTIPGARGLTDPLSGLFGFRASLLEHFERIHPGYKLLLAILSIYPQANVKEIPYQFGSRRRGQSKIVRQVAFPLLFVQEVLSDRRLHAKRAQFPPIDLGRLETGQPTATCGDPGQARP